VSAPLPETPHQLVLDLDREPAYGEVDFLVSDGNRLAFDHIAAFPRWPHPLTLIVGPAKSGKSHLGRIWAQAAGALVPRPDEIAALTGAADKAPILLEDVDRLPYDETALFHLLNSAMRDGRPILMTAREPVAQWPYRTNDVLSRARLAATFAISLAEDIHLSQVFVKLFGDKQITVDPKIISFLVPRMERSFEEAVRLVEVMDRLALARGKPISRAIAAQALALSREERGLAGGMDEDREDEDDE